MMQAVGEVYARIYHQTRFRFDAQRATVWRALCLYLQPWVLAAEPLLDLGAGYGEFSRFIQAKRKWALDLNPELMSYWDPEINPIIQSALSPLPFGESALGTVFASNFFEHFTVEHAQRILAEVRTALRPGGRLIVVQPNFRLEPRRYFDDYTHKTAYTDTGFAGLLEACGLRVIHAEPRFTPLTLKSRWPKAQWMVSLYLKLPFRPFAGQFLIVAERAQ